MPRPFPIIRHKHRELLRPIGAGSATLGIFVICEILFAAQYGTTASCRPPRPAVSRTALYLTGSQLSQNLPAKWPTGSALDLEFERDFGAGVVATNLLRTPANLYDGNRGVSTVLEIR
jgi:hypothetical protein